MSDKKNVLSDKQKHQLNKWLESGNAGDLSRTQASEWAGADLGCRPGRA